MTNACLFSGGKDSTLALHKVIDQGIDIDLLITMVPESRESYMFHFPNLNYTELQAESMGIRHVFSKTKGEKEKELADLEKALIDNNVKLLVTGATFSKYQGDRINDMCKRLGIEHIAPLWHIDPMKELSELAEKYNVIITSVSAEGLDTTILGTRLDKKMIDKLVELNKKYRINLVFEGGEAETFVLDAPLFRRSIHVLESHTEKKDIRGVYFIDDAELVDK